MPCGKKRFGNIARQRITAREKIEYYKKQLKRLKSLARKRKKKLK